jgi:uncharacterized NAD(P)/FAD-binding protein YdhS
VLKSGKTVDSEKSFWHSAIFCRRILNQKAGLLLNRKNIFKSLESENYSRIKSNDDVFIIGTGLSAVDAVLSLHNNRHTGKIYFFSTRGLLRLSTNSASFTVVL